MRPLTITYRITTKQISNFVRTEKDGRVRQRLMAMKFISLGQTIPQAAKRMDIAERPLRKWLHRFNKHGPSGLCDAPRSGQPPKLNAKRGNVSNFCNARVIVYIDTYRREKSPNCRSCISQSSLQTHHFHQKWSYR